jgi:CHASE2 domain-containing sensor protein
VKLRDAFYLSLAVTQVAIGFMGVTAIAADWVWPVVPAAVGCAVSITIGWMWRRRARSHNDDADAA